MQALDLRLVLRGLHYLCLCVAAFVFKRVGEKTFIDGF
jgi:hypothetical protein